MDAATHAMHIRAGIAYGQDRTCGRKVDYKTEERAAKSAEAMNRKSDHALEEYPCAWCYGWHIGRKMTAEEIAQFTDGEEG